MAIEEGKSLGAVITPIVNAFVREEECDWANAVDIELVTMSNMLTEELLGDQLDDAARIASAIEDTKTIRMYM